MPHSRNNNYNATPESSTSFTPMSQHQQSYATEPTMQMKHPKDSIKCQPPQLKSSAKPQYQIQVPYPKVTSKCHTKELTSVGPHLGTNIHSVTPNNNYQQTTVSHPRAKAKNVHIPVPAAAELYLAVRFHRSTPQSQY